MADLPKIYYIGIIRNDPQPAIELAHEYDLSSFSRFTRNSYAEFMTMFAKTVAERTRPGVRQDIEERGNVFHAYGSTAGIAGVIITNDKYPKMAAHQLLSKVVDEFTSQHPQASYISKDVTSVPYPDLKQHIVTFQDPNNASSIMKVQRELDETKIILHKTIESVLERGEKIDSLVQKSDGLSAQSKMFYQQAKKQNSCCTVM